MNNNRGNNRRRGRGNNRQQGGGMQANRIDSRARGNAPQMLDKYKKLAHDAQLNGDRVQAEYYLQFADHYFRVIADNNARRDESRPRRDDERDDTDDDDMEDSRARYQGRQRDRNDRDDLDDGEDGRSERDNRSERDDRDDREQRSDRNDRNDRNDRGGRGGGQSEDSTAREARPARPRPKRPQPRDDGAGVKQGLDPAALPPSIGADSDEQGDKPKRRPRRSKPVEESGDALEAAE